MALTAALSSPLVLAGWRELIPRPVENGAFLDLFTSFERDENRDGERTSRWNDTFLREKVSLFSTGFIYHPRFLQYQISFAGALKQENYESNFLDQTGWSSSSGVEYDGTITFLPEHPYNLELFARRYEPLFKEQSATARNNVETSHGAMFRYRRKPYFFNARYSNESVESGASTSDVKRFNLDGEYFNRFANGNQVSVSAAHNPSDFTTSSGLNGSSTQDLLSGTVTVRRLKLTSSVSRNTFDQESTASGRFENEQFSFHEILTAYLPLNFRSDLSYRIRDNTSTIPGDGSVQERDLTDRAEEYQLDIVHRLYQSLDSTFRYVQSDRTASGGDSNWNSRFLALNYTKVIPRGRILAGANLGRARNENQGRTDIVNEPHPATPVPGSFPLNQENADRRSIVVFLRSPLPPFDAVFLQEGADYFVTSPGNGLVINITLLPPQFVVPGIYDFFVSYSLKGGDFELRTDSQGYNASVELFEHLLTPYYSYLTVRTEELSGVFPGTPLDSTTHTAGLLFYREPLRARAEYQKLDWEVSPYRLWKADVQAVTSLRSAGNLYVTASYVNKRFPEGTSAQIDEAYTESTTSASGSLQKRLPARNLLMAAGGSISRLMGLVDSQAYSLNGSVTWTIGRLDLSMGAAAYRSDTEGFTSDPTTRTNQYYYLRIRRELF